MNYGSPSVSGEMLEMGFGSGSTFGVAGPSNLTQRYMKDEQSFAYFGMYYGDNKSFSSAGSETATQGGSAMVGIVEGIEPGAATPVATATATATQTATATSTPTPTATATATATGTAIASVTPTTTATATRPQPQRELRPRPRPPPLKPPQRLQHRLRRRRPLRCNS